MELRVLSAQDVAEALPMAEAIAGMKSAFAQLSAGGAAVPLRSRIDLARHQGVSLFMPAYLEESDDLGVKIVSVFPENVKRGEPSIYAAVLLLESVSGRPLALLEGGSLTAIRTGAGAGAATDVLALPGAKVTAIIGSGVQARTQLQAVCTVRDIDTVRLYSRQRKHAERFAAEMAGKGPVPQTIEVVNSPEQAVAGAHIICTATNSSAPVFDGRHLNAGTHINAVGSFTPTMQEVDAETIRRSLVVVDSREAALKEAGDLIVPLENGEISQDHIYAEVGEIIAGQKKGRSEASEITYFKSVGVAVQDVVAARIAYQNAVRIGLGINVSL